MVASSTRARVAAVRSCWVRRGGGTELRVAVISKQDTRAPVCFSTGGAQGGAARREGRHALGLVSRDDRRAGAGGGARRAARARGLRSGDRDLRRRRAGLPRP